MAGNNRARQFIPFAVLKGFDELLRECEIPREARREIGEDKAAEISQALCSLRRGTFAEVEYYDICIGRYIHVAGNIECVDLAGRWTEPGGIRVGFDDIADIAISKK